MRKTLSGLTMTEVRVNSSLDSNLTIHNLDINEAKEVILNKLSTKKEDTIQRKYLIITEK